MANDQWGSSTATVGAHTATFTPPPYTVNVTIEHQAQYNRFFAIPLIGLLARFILLIPHFIALVGVGIVVSLMQLYLWIPTLMNGEYPAIGYHWTGGFLRWALRVQAYFYGLTDHYPPFAFGSEHDGFPVNVSYDPSSSGSKLFAIPVVGYTVRYILLIPHLIVLYVLMFVMQLFQYILWGWVLFTGEYPEFGHSLVGGTLRWQTRMGAYFLGLTDRYPPFQLGN